jgi:hypothetical protein
MVMGMVLQSRAADNLTDNCQMVGANVALSRLDQAQFQ